MSEQVKVRCLISFYINEEDQPPLKGQRNQPLTCTPEQAEMLKKKEFAIDYVETPTAEPQGRVRSEEEVNLATLKQAQADAAKAQADAEKARAEAEKARAEAEKAKAEAAKAQAEAEKAKAEAEKAISEAISAGSKKTQ